MQNLTKQLEATDYNQILLQLKSFLNEKPTDASQTAMKHSLHSLKEHKQGKAAHFKALASCIKQGFLSLDLNPIRDNKGYLIGTSLEKKQIFALQDDWQKVGAHLFISMHTHKNI